MSFVRLVPAAHHANNVLELPEYIPAFAAAAVPTSLNALVLEGAQRDPCNLERDRRRLLCFAFASSSSRARGSVILWDTVRLYAVLSNCVAGNG